MKQVGFIGQHEMCKFTEFVRTNQNIDDQATNKAGGLAEQQLAKSFSLSEINGPNAVLRFDPQSVVETYQGGRSRLLPQQLSAVTLGVLKAVLKQFLTDQAIRTDLLAILLKTAGHMGMDQSKSNHATPAGQKEMYNRAFRFMIAKCQEDMGIEVNTHEVDVLLAQERQARYMAARNLVLTLFQQLVWQAWRHHLQRR